MASDFMKFHTSGSGFSPAAGPKKRPVKLKKKLMNVEHRTSNVQHRIMYSVELNKKTEQGQDNLTLNGEP
jgi:hypothetical protein